MALSKYFKILSFLKLKHEDFSDQSDLKSFLEDVNSKMQFEEGYSLTEAKLSPNKSLRQFYKNVREWINRLASTFCLMGFVSDCKYDIGKI